MNSINASHYIFFSYGLGVKNPWYIEDININNDKEKDSLIIKISFDEKEIIKCPVCGSICDINGYSEKIWRHIDFFNKKCFISVNIPKIKCESDGEIIINTPFGNNKSTLSSCLENYITLNSHFIPVKEISSYLGISEKIVWATVLKNISLEHPAGQICNVNGLLADGGVLAPL